MQQGIVTIDAFIDAEGNVVEMRMISGPPLLLQAALDAVRQWKYEPTYLNDQAIPVQLIVKVTFQLQH
jgi:periplasmic protein TonB